MEQSPIDIPADKVAAMEPPTFSAAYQGAPLAIEHNGHTVQVNWQPGSTLTLESGTYELQQFHFHAHSEHLLSGAEYPLEIHFVHKDETGALAVLGVFVDVGPENGQLAAILPHLPATESPVAVYPDTTIFASSLMPATAEAWSYAGSLTTPPCSEGVSWTVLSSPISASKEQIDALSSVLHDNFRPVHPLAGRLINGVDPNGPPM
jgi:carbonic anhydrase